MKVGVTAAIVLVACSFEHGSVSPVEPAGDTDDDASTPPIDAMPDARTCPSAPAGCTHFTCASSTSCYYACGDATPGSKKSWASARDACALITANTPACLVTIDDQEEQNCIVQQAMPSFPMANWIWIGLHQGPGTAEPLGGWEWQCGSSTFTQPPWGNGAGEPDENGPEDCAAITGGGGWFDATCGDAARYVCELP